MRTPLQNLPSLQITRFESCDSTNRQLLTAADAGAAAGSVYVARTQTAGRGRRGRTWLAAPGDSLAFSLLWTFPPDPARLSGLSLAVGLAIVRALSDQRLGKQRNDVELGLKWPNDLLIRRADGTYAKVGGMLIESTLRSNPAAGKELAVVIGIGLNCLDATEIAARITDQTVGALSELWVQAVSPDVLLPIVLEYLCETLDLFQRAGFAALQAAWNEHDLWQGQPVALSEAGVVLQQGICRGVDADGALRLETISGIERIITGDVSLRRV